MKEIKATAPTPQDWIELVRENERLREENERLTGVIEGYRLREKVRKMINSRYIGEQNK